MTAGKKGENTRLKIEKAAIEQFSIHGFQKTSYEMLASASGVTRANIQYHFPKKEDLFLSCVHRVAKENHAYLSEKIPIHLSAREKLDLHFRENLHWFLSHPEQAQIILGFYYLSCVEPGFAQACQAVLNTGVSRIFEYLLLGVRTKVFRLELAHLEPVAESLHDALIGSIIRSVTLGTPDGIEAEVQRAQEKWAQLFKGVLNETPTSS